MVGKQKTLNVRRPTPKAQWKNPAPLWQSRKHQQRDGRLLGKQKTSNAQPPTPNAQWQNPPPAWQSRKHQQRGRESFKQKALSPRLLTDRLEVALRVGLQPNKAENLRQQAVQLSAPKAFASR